MAVPQDFPVTTPFGQVPGYPLNNGFHNGIDYGCPTGTPVIVNGITIGISNNTGASTGPHLHVGKYVNGQVQDPGVGNGFQFNSAVVYDTGYDSTNGNYVRITGDGALWNYLHLEEVLVTKGQVLEGEDDMTQSEAEKVVTYFYRLGTGDYPNPGQAAYWVPRVKDVPTGIDELGIALLDGQKPSAQASYVAYSGPPLFTEKT
jgi:hypothetical protein